MMMCFIDWIHNALIQIRKCEINWIFWDKCVLRLLEAVVQSIRKSRKIFGRWHVQSNLERIHLENCSIHQKRNYKLIQSKLRKYRLDHSKLHKYQELVMILNQFGKRNLEPRECWMQSHSNKVSRNDLGFWKLFD